MGSAKQALRATWEAASKASRLQDGYESSIVNDIFRHAMRKQTGVSLKYMLDFGQRPIEKQMILSAQFLRAELPIRLAHRVAELENLPFGLSSMRPILKVSARGLVLIAQCSICPHDHFFRGKSRTTHHKRSLGLQVYRGFVIDMRTRALFESEVPVGAGLVR